MYFDSDPSNSVQITYSDDATSSFESEFNLVVDRSYRVERSESGADVVFRDCAPTYSVFDFAEFASSTVDSSSFFADESVARGYCETLNIGAMSLNHDEIMSHVDVVRTSVAQSTTRSEQVFRFAPGFHPISGQTVEPPLLPFTPMNTLFSCSRPIAEVVSLLQTILQEMDSHVRVEFMPYDFSWHCSFVSDCAHVDFCVRVFRYPKSNSLCGQFAVEFQRIEGDRSPFMNVYNAARDLLTSKLSSAEEIQDFLISRCHSGMFVSVTPIFGCGSFEAPSSSSSASTESSKLNGTASSEALEETKSAIMQHLTSPQSYAGLLETVQMVSSLYSTSVSSASRSPAKEDCEIFRALCTVAVHYSTNSADWIYRHSIIAVADMLAQFDFGFIIGSMEPRECEKVLGMLRAMAGVSDSNPYLNTKTEFISRLVVAM